MSVPEGWYPDPDGKPAEKYWDGEQWTDQTRPLVPKSTDTINAESVKQPRNNAKVGCLGWTIIAVVALILFSCVTGGDETEKPVSSEQESSQSEVQESTSVEIEYTTLQEWINGNNVSSFFYELGSLSSEIGIAANNFDVDRIANLLDDMAAIGWQMKMIKPSPDETFNQYWESVYLDLIELGNYTREIRNFNTEALEAATTTVQRMTSTANELSEYILSIPTE